MTVEGQPSNELKTLARDFLKRIQKCTTTIAIPKHQPGKIFFVLKRKKKGTKKGTTKGKELTSTRPLLGSVGDVITKIPNVTGTSVEGMQQAVPVSNFVGGGPSQIVARVLPTRHGTTEDVTPVDHVRRRIHTGDDTGHGECTEPQQRTARGDTRCVGVGLQQTLIVDVEGRVVSLAQRTFHAGVVAVAGPSVVGDPVDSRKSEPYAGVGVGVAEVSKLVSDHGVADVVGR